MSEMHHEDPSHNDRVDPITYAKQMLTVTDPSKTIQLSVTLKNSAFQEFKDLSLDEAGILLDQIRFEAGNRVEKIQIAV